MNKSAGEVKNVFMGRICKSAKPVSPLGYAKSIKGLSWSDPGERSGCEKYRENSANVFLEVNVPMRSIAVLDGSTGRKTIRENRELFTFQADENEGLFFIRRKPQETKNIFTAIKVL